CGAWRTTDDSKRDAAVRCHTALGSGCGQCGAGSLHAEQRKMSIAISAGLCCETPQTPMLPPMGLQEEVLSARCFSAAGTPVIGHRLARARVGAPEIHDDWAYPRGYRAVLGSAYLGSRGERRSWVLASADE